MKAKRSVIPVFVPHLGCPRDCIFCNQRSIAAPKEPSMEELWVNIEESLSRSGDGAELAFYGGSFTAIDREKRLGYLKTAYPFIKSGRLSSIRVSTRPDCITADILDELEYYGVKTIELGAQSMENRVLMLANRGHTAEDTVQASEFIKSHGFTLILQMMVGLPGENSSSPGYTAERIAHLEPFGVRIYPVAVIKHTALEHMWRDGRYSPLSIEHAAGICSELIEFFEKRGIAVIRVGLNPTEELGGEVVAGVYHPAFGELCRSRIYLRRARELLAGKSFPNGIAEIVVSKGKTSVFIGQKRENVEKLKSEFSLRRIKVREEDVFGDIMRLK